MPETSDKAFEQTFSDLAYAALQDQSPALIDHLIGFQVLDKNDENTHAVGMFGAKISDEWLYLPVFFMNGELKGTELAYLKNQDIFIPTKENWVTYILNRKPAELGEKTDVTSADMLGQGMDTSPLWESPIEHSKRSSDQSQSEENIYESKLEKLSSYIKSKDKTEADFYCNNFKKASPVKVPGWKADNPQPWTGEAVYMLKRAGADLTLDDNENLTPKQQLRKMASQLGTQPVSNLPEIISECGPLTAKHCASLLMKSAQVAKAASQFYDLQDFMVDKFKNFTHRSFEKKAMNGITSTKIARYYPDHSYVELDNDQAEQVKSAAEREQGSSYGDANIGQVRIVSYKEVNDWGGRAGLTDKEKERLMRGELVVHDNRDGSETSRVVNTELDQQTETVTESGVYDYLAKNGEVVRALIIVDPVDIFSASDRRGASSYYVDPLTSGCEAFMVNMKGSGCRDTDTSNITAQPVPGSFPGVSGIEGLEDPESMSVGNSYVLIDNKGKGTTAFKVISKRELGDGQVSFGVNSSVYCDDPELDDAGNVDTYVVLTKRGGKLNRINDTLFVPSTAKSCKITLEKEENKGIASDSSITRYKRDLMPAPCRPDEIIDTMWRTGMATPLKIYSTGTEYDITLGNVKSASWLTRRDALEFLAKQQGIQGDKACELLKSADVNNAKGRTFRCWINYGPGYPRFVKEADTRAPSISANDNYLDRRLGVPGTQPTLESAQIPGMAADARNARDAYNTDPRMDKDLYQKIDQAAQTGQQEVFDTAMLGSLVESVDSGNLIDQYIGDLILGMDRVGRIYFLFLQHNEDFSERYGQDDLVELEDSLRNTFKSLGDLVLFLKKKTVQLSPSEDKTAIGFERKNR